MSKYYDVKKAHEKMGINRSTLHRWKESKKIDVETKDVYVQDSDIKGLFHKVEGSTIKVIDSSKIVD